MTAPPRSGILNIVKPAGVTSRGVVDHVVRIVRPAKAGHAGTLDPLATGVLVVCVGRATRLIEVIHGQTKSYRGGFRLGLQSDTDDITGRVVEHPQARPVARDELLALLPRFTGRIAQVPPRVSAVHVDGERAYQRALRGEEVVLPPRDVDVYRLELESFDDPDFELSIDCGPGTYVRSIGRDIGLALGCGAVMTSLIRTRIGPFHVENAVTMDELSAGNLDRWLLPPAAAVEGLSRYLVGDDDRAAIRQGRALVLEFPLEAPLGATVAVLDERGELLCLAELRDEPARLQPRRVFI
jgi:tRNA pseudouridine55 synthase